VVKSILKPTIPLSPPKTIPPHASARKNSPSKTRSSPSKQSQADGLINSSTPDETTPKDSASVTGADRLSNPFEGSSVIAQHHERDTRVALRTEEEQQVAVKEREEKARRELEKKDVLERRDARRKSLGMVICDLHVSKVADRKQPTVVFPLLQRRHYIHGMLWSLQKIRQHLLRLPMQRAVRRLCHQRWQHLHIRSCVRPYLAQTHPSHRQPLLNRLKRQ